MRATILSLVIFLGCLGPVSAQDDPVSSVIDQQLNAFLEDDFETAFTFASPTIKEIFGSPERFESMVRNGYPMVHRPGRVTYLDQRAEDGATYQDLEIIDQNGRAHYLEYEMVETPYGWQINGVRFIEPPSTGA